MPNALVLADGDQGRTGERDEGDAGAEAGREPPLVLSCYSWRSRRTCWWRSR
nr:hypothetical protein [Halarchaeum acidiphilum]